MAVEPPYRLREEGITKLAQRFKYQRRSFAKVLQQLRNAGYIRYSTPADVGKRAEIELARRPLLIGNDAFVKL
jgi:MarR-like DNA-binding transcriptional regulator SgrR of sgrS sRNA